ncbi:hypothetical protein WJX81_007550 [Elliptochloris bilobata]|uniref:Major facilitator superfamily (MFS) profile domain-containing protein n=1 Tax=Elliptochloris bilobata TaxID=381761 RepID=A0AAW1QC58_9CHLO
MQARGGTAFALRQDVETPQSSPKLGKGGGPDNGAVEDAPIEALAEKAAEDAFNDSQDPEEPPVDWLITMLLFFFPAVGGLLFGYDIGATSGALESLKSAATSGTDWYQLTSWQEGQVVSASLFGALAGSALAFVVGDKLGRKRELQLGAALYGGAAAAMAMAPSLNFLLGGRALYGLGIGFAMHAAPAYIAEAAPARVRGLLISLKECFVVVGILLGYLASYKYAEQVGGWRAMYGLALPPALALLAGMTWLPDSPRWLLLSGAGRQAAANALSRARGRYGSDAATVSTEIAAMERAAERSGDNPGVLGLFQGRFARPLAVGTSLMFFQQVTGQPSVLYYASEIFEDAGFAAGAEANGISVLLGLFKLVMTGVAVAKVDSLGRRPLLLGGVSAMVASLLALGAAELALTGRLESYVSVAALLLYVGAYQISFGPISWLMVGEVFPLAVRGQASALATLTNFASNFAVSLVLPSMQDGLGPGATYLIFAGVGVVAVTTIAAIVPETKGKTLEEIEAIFKTGGKGE